MSGQQQRDPRGKDHLFWKGEKMIRQSKTDFYVCVRRRDEFGSDASSPLEARWPKGRLGAYRGIEAAHKGYCEAIDEYGPEYRVVIEPVEWVESGAEPEPKWWDKPDSDYSEEEKKSFRLSDEQEIRVEAALRAAGLEPPFHVRYSAYDDEPGDNLDEVAFKGRGIVVAHPDKFWGGEEAKLYFSDILTNPTWLELCVIAEQQIRTTKDEHHVFLESVDVIPRHDLELLAEADDPDGDVEGYTFFLGS